jgi:hypothetical protein
MHDTGSLTVSLLQLLILLLVGSGATGGIVGIITTQRSKRAEVHADERKAKAQMNEDAQARFLVALDYIHVLRRQVVNLGGDPHPFPDELTHV